MSPPATADPKHAAASSPLLSVDLGTFSFSVQSIPQGATIKGPESVEMQQSATPYSAGCVFVCVWCTGAQGGPLPAEAGTAS